MAPSCKASTEHQKEVGTTYPNVKQAFDSGAGDVFYQRGEEFICVSRKDPGQQRYLEAQGFNRMAYEDVERLAAQVVIPIPAVAAPAQTKERRMVVQDRYDWRDEFPDGFNGGL